MVNQALSVFLIIRTSSSAPTWQSYGNSPRPSLMSLLLQQQRTKRLLRARLKLADEICYILHRRLTFCREALLTQATVQLERYQELLLLQF